MDGGEALIPITMFAGGFAMVFGIYYLKTRQNLAMIEKGMNPKEFANRPAPYKNLKWATLETVSSHQQNSPEKIAYKKRQANKTVGLKLTATQVKTIKDSIKNPKRKLTYKQMAEKYGVSEMTLYRIKSGENWGRIK